MRVAVLGGCQAVGIAESLQSLLPEARVEAFQFHIPGWAPSPEDMYKRIPDYDFVVTQFVGRAGDLLEWERVRSAARKLSAMPKFVFSGFHPDCTYISDERYGILDNREIVLHSAIAAACFTLGLDEERALLMYNAFIFRTLGYYGVFEAAKRALFESYAEFGFDLSRYWDAWLAPGCFMHTLNHPASRVLGAMAHMAAERAGLIAADAPIPDPTDHLVNSVIWPVYPELARVLKCPGSLTWRGPVNSSGQRRQLNLEEFVRSSYATYRAKPDVRLLSGRVTSVYEKLATLIR